ncbi:hypothetical protein FNV43_RR11588 [Rhamnella rubrinervis]|uniref:Exostosin GT47 domain-containing protein n=1 Tax=Rhamnella rubrinervis TaxID=2594499 RepID=A0A8K0H697_9ROSA|nr:hypothetical protein FNV43_RR11588 [Rhamnella rubrinervis]
MVQKTFTLCQVETRRLLFIIGVLFAVVLVFQYFEFPYGTALPSLFSATKLPASGKSNQQNGDSQSNYSEIVGNISLSTDSNHNNTRSTSGFVSQGKGSSNSGFGLDEDDNDAKESASTNQAEQNRTSIVLDRVNNVDNKFAPEEARERLIVHDNVGNLSAGFVSPSVPAIHPTNSSEYTSPIVEVPDMNLRPKVWQKKPPKVVYSISDMNNMLLQSRAFYYSVIPQWSAAVDQELKYVASQIENAPVIQNDPNLYAPLFRNVSIFKRSYELMEDTLKVYIYSEGEKPILHTPLLEGIYASEGWFMKQLKGNKKFVTKNPKKAHLFYLPFSSRLLKLTLYVPDSHNRKKLIAYLKNYLDIISSKYPFWNRTGGADHFFAACHDWAPAETRKYMAKCIRALCNSDIKEGFVFGKDVSLPETFVRTPQNPLRQLGGKPPSKRSILAFFAGSMHGYVRPILLQHWENKDADMKIFARLPKSKDNKNYIQYMKNSKYCICAKGYEVNSPRVVEAISYECVPVIISDNYVPPLFDVLNWEAFAVFVMEKDIPNLKNILLSIPEKRYRSMQMRVKRVQQHFLWHAKPVKYDIFHMILHSVCFILSHYDVLFAYVFETVSQEFYHIVLMIEDPQVRLAITYCQFDGIGFEAKTRRLVLLLGIIVAVVLLIQYLELPYPAVLSSLFLTRGSPSKSEINDNMTLLKGLNSTYADIGRTSRDRETDKGNNSNEKLRDSKVNDESGSSEGSNNSFPLVYNNSSHVELDKSSMSKMRMFQQMVLHLRRLENLLHMAFPSRTLLKTQILHQVAQPKDVGLPEQSNESSRALSPSSVANGTILKYTNTESRSPVISAVTANTTSVTQWSSPVDQELFFAKLQIENAPITENDEILHLPLYRNLSMFKRSYELMEKILKVYVYQEGEKPIFHDPILEGIYASEGWFMKLMEANKNVITKDPTKAHLFYLPYSSQMLKLKIYVPNSHKRANVIKYMKGYVDMIAMKYSFWNRTNGKDHFLAACHDWAPAETRGRMLSCIRALCNADLEVGFKIGKDVSLPETYVHSKHNPTKYLGGNPPSQRPTLAFFAGRMHGYLRPILLKYWGNKDSDMKIFDQITGANNKTDYFHYMKSSKYCICARGHEVNSPRVVEAIFYNCVPVIISDNFVPPFFEILNWESFAVFVLEEDVPNLKNILLSISEERYMEMYGRVEKVQQHFLWHEQPVKYDLFHMILHNIWYNRVFQLRPM